MSGNAPSHAQSALGKPNVNGNVHPQQLIDLQFMQQQQQHLMRQALAGAAAWDPQMSAAAAAGIHPFAVAGVPAMFAPYMMPQAMMAAAHAAATQQQQQLQQQQQAAQRVQQHAVPTGSSRKRKSAASSSSSKLQEDSEQSQGNSSDEYHNKRRARGHDDMSEDDDDDSQGPPGSGRTSSRPARRRAPRSRELLNKFVVILEGRLSSKVGQVLEGRNGYFSVQLNRDRTTVMKRANQLRVLTDDEIVRLEENGDLNFKPSSKGARSGAHSSSHSSSTRDQDSKKRHKSTRRRRPTHYPSASQLMGKEVRITAGQGMGMVGVVQRSGHGFYAVAVENVDQGKGPSKAEYMKRATEIELVTGAAADTHHEAASVSSSSSSTESPPVRRRQIIRRRRPVTPMKLNDDERQLAAVLLDMMDDTWTPDEPMVSVSAAIPQVLHQLSTPAALSAFSIMSNAAAVPPLQQPAVVTTQTVVSTTAQAVKSDVPASASAPSTSAAVATASAPKPTTSNVDSSQQQVAKAATSDQNRSATSVRLDERDRHERESNDEDVDEDAHSHTSANSHSLLRRTPQPMEEDVANSNEASTTVAAGGLNLQHNLQTMFQAQGTTGSISTTTVLHNSSVPPSVPTGKKTKKEAQWSESMDNKEIPAPPVPEITVQVTSSTIQATARPHRASALGKHTDSGSVYSATSSVVSRDVDTKGPHDSTAVGASVRQWS